MNSDLEMKLKDLIWYSPLYIEKHLRRTYKKVDKDVFERSGKFKRAREIRLGRILALCLNAFKEKEGDLHFVALPSSDPPDICVLGKIIGTKTPPLIYSVEVTTYIGTPTKSILQHLQDADKIPKDHHNFGPNETILINVGIGLTPDLHSLNEYLKSIKAPYSVWALQDVTREGTTIARFTEVYPNFRQVDVNVALEGIKLQSKLPMERVTINRSGPSKSGEITRKDNVPETIPWE